MSCFNGWSPTGNGFTSCISGANSVLLVAVLSISGIFFPFSFCVYLQFRGYMRWDSSYGIGGRVAGGGFVLSVSLGVAYAKFPGTFQDKSLLNIFSSLYNSAFVLFITMFGMRFICKVAHGCTCTV